MDGITLKKGKESHINHVSKTFIKDDFTLIIIIRHNIKIKIRERERIGSKKYL
jgi:hypothetical protein